jgi:hypothetical protein
MCRQMDRKCEILILFGFSVLDYLQILRLGQEHLVRVLARAEWVGICSWVHLRHLLGHLACGCGGVSTAEHNKDP